MLPLLSDKSLLFLVNILDAFIRVSNYLSVIVQECGQTLARVRVIQTDIVSIIISLQWMESM